jgi:hypothetical protein
MFKKSCFNFSLGVGYVRLYYTLGKNNSPTIFDFPMGVLFKPRYKKNGLLFGIFVIRSVGKISYRIDDGRNQINYYHNSSWQVSPNLSYEFQPKSKSIFFRLTVSPKFLPPFFNRDSVEYGMKWKIVPWGGISIGGVW